MERYTTSLQAQWIWRREGKVNYERIGTRILYKQELCDEMALRGEFGVKPMLAVQALQNGES